MKETHLCECGKPALRRTTTTHELTYTRDHPLCARCFRAQQDRMRTHAINMRTQGGYASS